MLMDIQKEILDPMDLTLVAIPNVPDYLCSIEDSVWSDLNDSVELGFRTMEEAQQRFMDWRHSFLGKVANSGL